MAKKVFICFFVLLLLTTMVVPAFATSVGGDGSVVRPRVDIEYIKFLNGTYSGAVLDWPNSWSNGGLFHGEYGDGAGSVYMQYSCDNTSGLSTYASLGNTDQFTLFCSDYFWSNAQHFSIEGEGSTSFSTVSISGDVISVGDINGRYSFSTKHFTSRYSVYNSYLGVDDYVYQALLDAGYTSGYLNMQDTVYLQNVTITIKCYRTTSDPFSFTTRTGTLSSSLLNKWLWSQTLVVQSLPADMGLFDWLLNSVDAFLNFQIVPGITLNGLFYIVLVIGVLIWFIRLFS